MRVDNLLSMPDSAKWDLSCLADRWPSCCREDSAGLLASLGTQHCDGAAPGHISDPHWQPRVATTLVSWCGVPLADAGEQENTLLHVTSV